jgi:hypothetical protein
MDLEHVNLVVGLVMSLAGSVAVAPSALPELAKMVKKDAEQFRAQLARIVPRLRKDATEHGLAARGSAQMPGNVTITANGLATPRGSTEEQLDQLWKEIGSVREEGRIERQALRARDSILEQSISQLSSSTRSEHERIYRQIDHQEKEQTELEARALPLIGFGIVISGLAADLAKLPVWIDVVGLVLATIFSLRIVVPIASKKRKEKLGRVKADKALGQ